MQTFVPVPDFVASAEFLDYRRLGKQRVETMQIINAIVLNRQHGWRNHPATKMWMNNVNGLSAYGVAICEEWIRRGFKDTCLGKIKNLVEPDFTDLPVWWGDDRVHSSHRANLLRKYPEHYREFGWTEDPTMEYFWPSSSYELLTTGEK